MKKIALFPLLFIGLLSLLAAMWAGLIRLGWAWPVLQPALPMNHGPLIVSGFLGTVIGLERAVALSASLTADQSHRWTYLGPILTSLGALMLLIGIPGPLGPALLALGSLNLVAVFGLILKIQLVPYTLTMALGALLWFTGNSLWLLGWPIYTVVFWWMGFLILTIAGERLELGRILRLSSLVQAIFGGIVGVFLLGLLLSLFHLDWEARVTGAAMAALALWLFRYDVARYTVRKSGLTRFMAVSLLSGYGWLGLSGLLSLIFGGVVAGFHYDAVLHAVFVGFVISMIFAHAPIIFPAITGQAVPFKTVFYLHLALLHLSLLLRVGSDLIIWLPGRQWGGLLNVAAILLFMVNTLLAIRTTNQPSTQGVTARVT